MEKKNYYQMLGINENASPQSIKESYRKLSLKIHPDVNKGEKFFEEYFKQILEAYEILSDVSKRRNYDQNIDTNSQSAEKEKRTLKEKISILDNEIKQLKLLISNIETEKRSLKQSLETYKKDTSSEQRYNSLKKEYNELVDKHNYIVERLNKLRKKVNWPAWILFGVLLLLFFSNTIDFSQGEKERLRAQVNTLELSLNKQKTLNLSNTENEAILKNKITLLQNKLNQISSEVPFLVKGIDFSNSANPEFFTSVFTKSDIRYIFTRLKIVTVGDTPRTIKLDIKMINPDGSIKRSFSNSPLGYSFSDEVTCDLNTSLVSLKGWGNSESSTYDIGQYKVEVWNNSKILYIGTFDVYQ